MDDSHPAPALIVDPDHVDIMVRTLDGEGRGEPQVGLIGIAWTIRTRATWDGPLDPSIPEHEWWGTSIGGVCLHHFQYSCWSDKGWNASNLAHMKALKPDSDEYEDLLDICQAVLAGTMPDPTNSSTHYKVAGTAASWDNEVAMRGIQPVRLGRHLFYRIGPS